MGEQPVVGDRGVLDWILVSRARAQPLLTDLLALPDREWDRWLESHPDARVMWFFQGLVELAERDPQCALPLTAFVVRHVDALPAPAEAPVTLTFLRGHAWEARAVALLRAGDPSGALQAYERSAAVFRTEPLLSGLTADVEHAAAGVVPGLAARLLRETPYADWPSLAEREELHTIGALTELSAAVVERVEVVPVEALAIAEIATSIADALPADSYPSGFPAHLRAQAWKDRGLALGALARYPEALAALEHAEEIAGGWKSLEHDRAIVRLARATTLQEAGRTEESEPLLAECRAVFEEHGDVRRQLLASMVRGTLLHRQGRFHEARAVLEALLPAVRAFGDSSLLARTHNNLGYALAEIGDFAAAGAHLDQAVALFTKLEKPLLVTRSELARGRMLLRKGELSAAIPHLHDVRARFQSQNLAEEAGLCGLDIVEAHLLRGAPIEAEAFARQIVREFTAAQLNARAITALGYLSESIAAREASTGTVERVRRYIRSLRTRPDADFAATA